MCGFPSEWPKTGQDKSKKDIKGRKNLLRRPLRHALAIADVFEKTSQSRVSTAAEKIAGFYSSKKIIAAGI